jgi:hypothetical protein
MTTTPRLLEARPATGAGPGCGVCEAGPGPDEANVSFTTADGDDYEVTLCPPDKAGMDEALSRFTKAARIVGPLRQSA